jgi:hypothetical protein
VTLPVAKEKEEKFQLYLAALIVKTMHGPAST